MTTGCASVDTGLSRWRRFLNWLASKLGADQKPFIDPLNHWKHNSLPLSVVANPELIDSAMKFMADKPVCYVCGSKRLAEDPAGYYRHAVSYDGAPLLCLENHK